MAGIYIDLTFCAALSSKFWQRFCTEVCVDDRYSPAVLIKWFLIVAVFSIPALAAQRESVIVRSDGSRETLKQKVQALGGTIRYEFKNLNAVSAMMPSKSAHALTAVPGMKVNKLLPLRNPFAGRSRIVSRTPVKVNVNGKLKLDHDAVVKNLASRPADYLFNNALINALSVQVGGNLGGGVVVAVIDSGVANNPDVVPTLDGNVIGGESFVPADVDPVTSATSTKNGEHGTMVSTMIAGHGAFIIPNDDCLIGALQNYSPDSIIDATPFGFPGSSLLPVIGVAPEAQIYALKVFPSNDESATGDSVLMAMDRAITLKKNFLAGEPSVPVSGSGTEDDPFVYESLNIQVVNMSLGGLTLASGRDLLSQMTQEMLKAGILVAASTGNGGPTAMTINDTSGGLGSLGTAATDDFIHERIFWDEFASDACTLGAGFLAFPTPTIQTASFSSRGPTPDGRIGVGVTSAGTWNFVQAANGDLFFVSGTSFSSPTVAGAAALLQAGFPNASAARIRNAILKGANPDLLNDDSGPTDRGRGYLDVARSLKLLKRHHVSGDFPSFPEHSSSVSENLHRLGIPTYRLEPGSPIHFNARNLSPGERQELIFRVTPDTGSVKINLKSVTPKLPPEKQNQLFGDDIFLAIHPAKTSEASSDDNIVDTFFNAPATFTVDNPETGLMRIAVLGDATNVGKVSAKLTIRATAKQEPFWKRRGTVRQGDQLLYSFKMPEGLAHASFELTWKNDWAHYPTNDIDLVVIDPDGNEIDDGATIDTREIVSLDKPKAGTYQLYVIGFDVFGHLLDDGSERGPQADRFRLAAYIP
jgi:subtilisin family serine protease